VEGIGQKDLVLAGFGITIADTTQQRRALFGFSAGQANRLIGGNA